MTESDDVGWARTCAQRARCSTALPQSSTDPGTSPASRSATTSTWLRPRWCASLLCSWSLRVPGVGRRGMGSAAVMERLAALRAGTASRRHPDSPVRAAGRRSRRRL